MRSFCKLQIIIIAVGFMINSVCGQSETKSSVQVMKTRLLKTTIPLKDIKSDEAKNKIITRSLKEGYHPKKDWILHEKVNPNALPFGEDPVLQKIYSPTEENKNLELDFTGMGYSAVNPADPNLAVGPNHVVQMINGPSGSFFRIFDKSGNNIRINTYLDQVTGISGKGDPIALYDQFADRWIMAELADGPNKIVIAVSTSPDPTGQYYIYEVDTPAFPDYPKLAIWSDAYYITTNEQNEAGIYALDKNRMLSGSSSPRTLRFTIPEFQSISFQASTPVTLEGTALPPAGTPGMIMRIADDAWETSINSDRLEMFQVHVDFDSASNSYLSAPQYISVQPFDTELCGYTSFSCIEQPGNGIGLDPLREVLMHRISYRNFGSHQSIVCNHVTDVNGNDRAGIRWYELRKSSSWGIHQQGTYAPNDGHSRWMAAISQNSDGAIGLAYNISSSSLFPSIRYTGRKNCDPLGQMTYPETVIKEGESFSNSNRWGDYTGMAIDPIDDSFWYTAAYATSGSWRTYIAKFSMDECDSEGGGIDLSASTTNRELCAGENTRLNFNLSFLQGYSNTTYFTIENLSSHFEASLSAQTVNSSGNYTLDIEASENTPDRDFSFLLKAVSGAHVSTLSYTIKVKPTLSSQPQLTDPVQNAQDVSVIPYFDWTGMVGTDEYELEISLNSSMTSQKESYSQIGTSNYTPVQELAANTTYYWRVRGMNDCGYSPYSSVYSFTTEGTIVNHNDCVREQATDLPKVISSGDPSTITSEVYFPYSGIIQFVTIKDINIQHSYISDLILKLRSPNGTEVTLLSSSCGNTDNLNLDFSDNGSIDIPCPPTTGYSYRPQTPFSNFENESAKGTWKLIVEDSQNQDGGSLDSWSLDICLSENSNTAEVNDSDCDPIISHMSMNIPSGMHQADINILSTGRVVNTGDVNYRSGIDIDLNPGFEVLRGGIFEAKIGDCFNN